MVGPTNSETQSNLTGWLEMKSSQLKAIHGRQSRLRPASSLTKVNLYLK